MARKSFNGRLLMLSDIEEANVNKIIEAIYYFNEEDDKIRISTEIISSPEKLEPIKIVLKSKGGDMYDGLALIDTIDNSKTPIHITAHGCIMSMALNVLVSGHKKFCGKNTTFMYHEGWYEVGDKNIQEHKEELKEAERLDQLCDNYLISKTKLTVEKLNKIKESRKNWYFDAEEAYRYGVIDQIL